MTKRKAVEQTHPMGCTGCASKSEDRCSRFNQKLSVARRQPLYGLAEDKKTRTVLVAPGGCGNGTDYWSFG